MHLANQRKVSTDHWMSLSVGSSSCHIDILQIRKNSNIGVEWNVPDDKDLYHKLYEHKYDIESEMGVQLDWRELPEKKASRIVILTDADFDNKSKWQEQFEWVMDTSQKMKKAFKKYI